MEGRVKKPKEIPIILPDISEKVLKAWDGNVSRVNYVTIIKLLKTEYNMKQDEVTESLFPLSIAGIIYVFRENGWSVTIEKQENKNTTLVFKSTYPIPYNEMKYVLPKIKEK